MPIFLFRGVIQRPPKALAQVPEQDRLHKKLPKAQGQGSLPRDGLAESCAQDDENVWPYLPDLFRRHGACHVEHGHVGEEYVFVNLG